MPDTPPLVELYTATDSRWLWRVGNRGRPSLRAVGNYQHLKSTWTAL
jgi:hypothetical protein